MRRTQDIEKNLKRYRELEMYEIPKARMTYIENVDTPEREGCLSKLQELETEAMERWAYHVQHVLREDL